MDYFSDIRLGSIDNNFTETVQKIEEFLYGKSKQEKNNPYTITLLGVNL